MSVGPISPRPSASTSAASSTSEERPAIFRAQLRTALADGKLTEDEFIPLQTELYGLPTRANADTRELLRVWIDFVAGKVELCQEAINEFPSQLAWAGYDVPQEPIPDADLNAVFESARQSNVGELDHEFLRLTRSLGKNLDDVRIGVIDSGTDVSHPGLKKNLIPFTTAPEGDPSVVPQLPGWDFAAKTNQQDGVDHGTHVTGIATRGTPHIDALAVHASGESMATALDALAKEGARVVNISMRSIDPAHVKALNEAIERHPEMLVVRAAGNDGLRSSEFFTPENEVILTPQPNLAVVGSAGNGKLAGYSNRGAPFVTHAAEGSVRSTVPGGVHQSLWGTSMAAPNFSQVAAKCLVLDPALTPEQLKLLLKETSTVSPGYAQDVEAGGPIHPTDALQVAALTGQIRAGTDWQTAASTLGMSPETWARLRPIAEKLV